MNAKLVEIVSELNERLINSEDKHTRLLFVSQLLKKQSQQGHLGTLEVDRLLTSEAHGLKEAREECLRVTQELRGKGEVFRQSLGYGNVLKV
jgi:hypothetical protein